MNSISAVDYWDSSLSGWGLPQALIEVSAESPFASDPTHCDRLTEENLHIMTPSRLRALELLPRGASVLDVGCGAGVASLSLTKPIVDSTYPNRPYAGHVIGVDTQPEMLRSFANRAEALGTTHQEILGSWPDVADQAPQADVVICHHVMFNVRHFAPFVRALNDKARVGVVIEMPVEHPLAWLRPLWLRLHGLQRPMGPTIDDAMAAARELGLRPELETWHDPLCSPRLQYGDDLIPQLRRRLCVTPDRDPEIRALLSEFDLPTEGRTLATISWHSS